MNKQGKEELSEAIGDGIYEGFGKIVGTIALAGIAIVIGCIALAVLNNYYHEYEMKKCIESDDCTFFESIPGTVEQSCFPLKNLDCEIIAGNETYEEPVEWFGICGYQEANEKYKLLKPQLEQWLRERNISYEIKRMECD
ncbi:MAG: hypothetical protein KAR20_17165 [Candidatus Heimdallarchaeota archaeon]|nr:hypothetical protein [Candidatus Heimdallarchaeota archaeon]